MQGAWAPRDQGQSHSRMGALNRPSVILLTYVLATIEFTCLFMQFSIMPYLSRNLGLDSIAFGYLQTIFGVLQLLCGPVFGRIQCPAILAALATLLGAVLSFTCIPASTKGARTDAQAPPPGSPRASVFDLKAIGSLLRLPDVPRIFLVKVASTFPSGLFMIMFSIISMDFFQLEAAQAGYLMSFFGLLQMVTQGLVIGWLSSHFSEEALLRASVLVFIAVGLAMASMSSVFHFCLLVPGLVFSMCSLNVVTDSMLTKAVSSSDTGTMLGLCASVQPLLRTLGPTLGGLLYRSFGVPIFGHVQIVVNTLVLLLLWRKPMPQRKDKVR
uniref:Solute carrier family 22 member 18 n=1 Tax=Saimiri boliviensis boliviensis TaxID=39432 RepID=A0A2K6TH81_SAIBB